MRIPQPGIGRSQGPPGRGSAGATGPIGPPGVGANPRGIWSSGTTYALGDGVYRNGLPYISNVNGNLNHDPATDNGTNWGSLSFTPFTYVDSLSAAPRSVTDWGSILNTAIAGGTRYFIFGPFDYPVTTTINFNSISGITLEGATGAIWANPPASSGYTRLLWGGTGAGFAVDTLGAGTGAVGITFRNLGLEYTSTSFTGGMVNCYKGTQFRFEQVAFDTTTTIGTASVTQAVRLRNINSAVFDQCSFYGYNSYVTGYESASDFATPVRFRDCVFQGQCTQQILNPGTDWSFDHCTFEMVPDLGNWAYRYGITANIPYSTDDSISVTLLDCQYWDAPVGAQKVVYAPAGNYWEFTAINCRDHNGAGSLAKLYDFQGTGHITILGGNTRSIIDVGNAASATQTGNTHTSTTVDNLSSPSSIVVGSLIAGSGIPANTYVVSVNVGGASAVISQATTTTLTGTTLTIGGAKKRMVSIRGVDIYSTSTSTGLLLNVNTGHQAVDVAGNNCGADNALGVSGEIQTLAHERVHYVDQPGIAAHAGVTNQTQFISGADLTGFIVLHNSAGVTGPTSLLADVTLARSIAGLATSTHNGLPLVDVWPFEPDDANSAYLTPNMATTYACQPYAYAKSLANGGAQNAFSIGVNVGIPAGGTIGIGYRVTHL